MAQNPRVLPDHVCISIADRIGFCQNAVLPDMSTETTFDAIKKMAIAALGILLGEKETEIKGFISTHYHDATMYDNESLKAYFERKADDVIEFTCDDNKEWRLVITAAMRRDGSACPNCKETSWLGYVDPLTEHENKGVWPKEMNTKLYGKDGVCLCGQCWHDLHNVKLLPYK